MTLISSNTRPANSVRLNVTILELRLAYLLSPGVYAHIPSFGSKYLGWFKRILIKSRQCFIRSEVERLTNQTEIFSCGIWISQQVLERHKSKNIWSGIYTGGNHRFSMKKLLFGGKKSLTWKLIVRGTYLLHFLFAKH